MVGGTGGLGVYALRSPGLSATVAVLPDGTLVQRTGRQVQGDGHTWVQVVLRDGRIVWIAGAYLVPYGVFVQPPH